MLYPYDLSHDISTIAKIEAVPLILNMVKHVTGMRFAAIARVTERKWVACAVDDSIEFGLIPGGELVLETTICHEIRQHRKPVIFKNASEHPVYSTHHTPKTYGLESYVSIPITRTNGDFFGTLCAIDQVPAHFDEDAVCNTLTLFAQLIAVQLDVLADLEAKTIELANAAETGIVREQFIAVLGHDLRSPLSAIRMSADLLEAKLPAGREQQLAIAIRQSSQRMNNLIEDVLDFSRGKLGGGIPVKRTLVDNLGDIFIAVINEIMTSHPHVKIRQEVIISPGVFCDAGRMGQLLSNLLGNAVAHGARDLPIEVIASMQENHVVLSVMNHGPEIPDVLLPLLFQPFKRSAGGGRGEGLGLGLYIASQIVTGHNGTLSVTSTPEDGTRFVARFPGTLEWAKEH
ncbi:TPA: GAF domain-containing sensor histidine kinase [Pseudomonas putida]|uniref:GAF domain-containing sensor histidine kinase n=1 Tax=Pseudomonas putida TaxID=303 RepID=UPI00110CDC27|nr:GAF domain-containing sensor histidine kinase [Pseudomonas putida]MDD1996252.1 GAF domain-containing sensor histidine kinase [Pseudomonas putida]HDS0921143.1 GAF domain-containing sensor histidine kinase [Pseudomonas putida]HDS0936427.1 GAF domain-containing sensor histidine kinase [Pseudomonas putida]HDS1786221.1 GAF domain-containing sensor histidine kinase [Pseudomonas putida]HDS3801693.1 GAF domain-containing sensor histidine kinase [Pseudomonas putida]